MPIYLPAVGSHTRHTEVYAPLDISPRLNEYMDLSAPTNLILYELECKEEDLIQCE